MNEFTREMILILGRRNYEATIGNLYHKFFTTKNLFFKKMAMAEEAGVARLINTTTNVYRIELM